VQPVSLLFRGRIEHRDSLGNDRTVRSGGIQWLVAGSGALHEEVLNGDENGIFHMAQLWVNLPASLKMDPPQHHAVPADAVPEIDSLGDRTKVRLYAGELEGAVGPAPLPTPVLVGHVQMGSGGSVSIPVPAGWTAAACVVDGADAGQTVVFNDDGDSIAWRSDTATELLLMCGQPLGEPIAMGGGFVMNTETEIEAAFDEYRSGLMGQLESSR
jgi:redox-sensitive bicupin YhaK (pirin superfamily)